MDPQLMAIGAKLLGGAMTGKAESGASSSGFMDSSNWTVNFGAGSNGSSFTTTPTSTATSPAGTLAGGIQPMAIALIMFGAAALILILKRK